MDSMFPHVLTFERPVRTLDPQTMEDRLLITAQDVQCLFVPTDSVKADLPGQTETSAGKVYIPHVQGWEPHVNDRVAGYTVTAVTDYTFGGLPNWEVTVR